MKKILLLFLFVFSLFLVSCQDESCTLKTIDENGNEISLDVKETSDKEEVTQVITVLNSLNSEEATKYLEVCKYELQVTGNIKNDNYTMNNTGNVEAFIPLHEERNEIFLAYYSMQMSSMITTDQQVTVTDLYYKTYIEAEYVYDDQVCMFDNQKVYGIKKKSLYSESDSIFETLLGIEMDDNFLDFSEYKNEEDFSRIVEDHKIEITKVEKNSITFSYKLGYNDSFGEYANNIVSKIEYIITIDVVKKLPISMSVDMSEFYSELMKTDIKDTSMKYSIKFSYGNMEFPRLTEEEKLEYSE